MKFAPLAELIRLRSYSRLNNDKKETWEETCQRTIYSPHDGIAQMGNLTPDETELVYRMQRDRVALGSSRFLWVGGTEWFSKPENASGAYNCTSLGVTGFDVMAEMMNLAMMGSGTGGVLEEEFINQIPPIKNKLNVTVMGQFGLYESVEDTLVIRMFKKSQVVINVGDSRKGWVDAYQAFLELSIDERFPTNQISVVIDISHIRPKGQNLKGFGGVSNPDKLPGMFPRLAAILNDAHGRKLNTVECCLLIDEAALVVVAGNIRRCLPENALVHTSNGLVPIMDVKIGDLVQTPLGFRKVLNKFDQGEQEVWNIKTNSTTLRATPNHRVAVFTSATGDYEWKHLYELKEGDRLMHTNKVLKGTKTTLPADFTESRPKNSSTCKEIFIPELDEGIAWLIGFTHANGYVGNGINKHGKPWGIVSWSTNHLYGDLKNRIVEKIRENVWKFGLRCSSDKVASENTHKVNCSSIRLSEYFRKYIKLPNTPINIPGFILQATPNIRAAYLAGVFDGDGCQNNRPPQLAVSIYSDFRRQLAALYSSLGIPARFDHYAPKERNWNTKYYLTIPTFKAAFNSLVAPYSLKGSVKEPKVESHTFSFPKDFLTQEYSYSQIREMGFNTTSQVATYKRYVTATNRDLDIPVTVEGLDSVDVFHTYDIEVEETNCFYCEGYLTHNSAGMRQASYEDDLFAGAKDNLWQQDSDGNWKVDAKRDSLRMANHTRICHQKPSFDEIKEAVTKQFYSGEGAIMYAPESIARCNVDLLNSPDKKAKFLEFYQISKDAALGYLEGLNGAEFDAYEAHHRMHRYGLNPCGEICGSDFHCNLASVHLNQLDPVDFETQKQAFRASALQAASFLNRGFDNPLHQKSRDLDPIIGVSFTGAFTFFVKAFGVDWLRWWQAGRPKVWASESYDKKAKMPQSEYFLRGEREYLELWKHTVEKTVREYCDRHGLKRPNRCTTLKPEGSQTLLTGVGCNGHHAPKSWRYIRRMTFAANDPIALAAMDYGYSVVPGQADKDDDGGLLNDPFDPRCTEWLVEVPVEEEIVSLFPDAKEVDPSQFSALAQFDWLMQVQNYYVTHNTSATLEFKADEIEPLSQRIYDSIQNDEGYVSAALLARFESNATFPRLPFEPISKEKYDDLMFRVGLRRKSNDFQALFDARLNESTQGMAEPQDSACGDGFCAIK